MDVEGFKTKKPLSFPDTFFSHSPDRERTPGLQVTTPPNSIISPETSLLGLEAYSAVQEVLGYVKSISISEKLPRGTDLLFLNLVTFEGDTYCVELSDKGWKICSNQTDQVDQNVKINPGVYYETIYALLDQISSAFREKFGKTLAEKLSKKLADRVVEDT